MGLLFKICRSVHEQDEYAAEVEDCNVVLGRDDSPQDPQLLLELLAPTACQARELGGGWKKK